MEHCMYIPFSSRWQLFVMLSYCCNSYHGEKLERLAPTSSTKKKKLMKDVIISTVYDKPEEVSSNILRSAPSHTLKHRAVIFQGGGLLKQAEDTGELTANTQQVE